MPGPLTTRGSCATSKPDQPASRPLPSPLRAFWPRIWLLAALTTGALAAALLPAGLLLGQAEPEPGESDVIAIEADYAQQWQPEEPQKADNIPQGLRRQKSEPIFFGSASVNQDEIFLLRGRCRLRQGPTSLQADKMVVWKRREDTPKGPRDRIVVYLEDAVRLEQPGQSLSESSMFVNLGAQDGISVAARHRIDGQPATEDALYQRALERRQGNGRNSLRPTQLVVPQPPGGAQPLVQLAPPSGLRRIRISPRSAVPFDVSSFPSTDTVPPEQIWVLTGGINVLVDDDPEFGTVDLSADRMVIWTRPSEGGDFRTELTQTSDTPFTVYLEGNIVIRQGPNVVRASHAIYDAREDRGVMLNADLRQFIPLLGTDVRVRASRIRQLAEDTYYAQDAWTTASQFGKPGYRLQASDVFIEPRVLEPLFGDGIGRTDPWTGQPFGQTVPWITSLDNTFYIHDLPVFYLPRVSGPAEDPKIPIRNVTVRYDRVFGMTGKITWDMFDLLGWDDPPGVRWDLLTDYYGDRGPGLGTAGAYRGNDLFDIPGPYFGQGLAYYVNDQGLDRLGIDRMDLPIEDDNRGRLLWRHRQIMPSNTELRAEIGVLSDRNFLEQYFETEWDTGKDNETLLYLKQQFEPNQAWSVLARPQVNDFETTTEWLPRGDHFLLGEPILGGLLTYYSHSQAGYGRLRQGDPPAFPQFDPWTPLPYVNDVEGTVLATRHEINAPFSLGPVRVVPYGLGEADHWSEDLTGESLGRLYGMLGVRSTLAAWRVYPYAQSRIFNVNGLAHKMLWEIDAYTSNATENLGDVPQYNEFDDDAQERFRHRYLPLQFGNVFPPQVEPRFYAARTGAGNWVTAPWYELVDDIQVMRMAWRHRLQTKVGPPERMRIRDWMTLDLEASYFPDEDDDNFGEPFGLVGGRYLWAFSERTSLLANTQYDYFENAPQLWEVGVSSQRDARGNLYAGIRQVKAANIESQFVTFGYSYVMSPKWNSTFSTAYDIGEGRNIGQTVMVTRVGADWLFHVGANYDAGKDNAGVAVMLEPRLSAAFGINPIASMLNQR